MFSSQMLKFANSATFLYSQNRQNDQGKLVSTNVLYQPILEHPLVCDTITRFYTIISINALR